MLHVELVIYNAFFLIISLVIEKNIYILLSQSFYSYNKTEIYAL